jgi:hypothetical protein
MFVMKRHFNTHMVSRHPSAGFVSGDSATALARGQLNNRMHLVHHRILPRSLPIPPSPRRDSGMCYPPTRTWVSRHPSAGFVSGDSATALARGQLNKLKRPWKSSWLNARGQWVFHRFLVTVDASQHQQHLTDIC